MLPNDELAARSRPPVHVRITGRRSWFDFGAKEMWQFRELIHILAVRDIKLRYRQTALGVAGVVLAPLLTAGVLTFVFGQVANLPSEGVPYLAFSYAGFLGWNVFANLIGRSSTALLGNASLVSKIYVPRLLLPVSGIFVAMVDFVIASIMMLALMVVYQIVPGMPILLLPLWLFSIIALGLGIGVAAGAAMVHYRDVGVATTAGLQALLYLTPVAYSADLVPERFRELYLFNPLGALIEGLRWSLLGSDPPGAPRVVVSISVSIVVLLVGCAIFNRLERGFADVI